MTSVCNSSLFLKNVRLLCTARGAEVQPLTWHVRVTSPTSHCLSLTRLSSCNLLPKASRSSHKLALSSRGSNDVMIHNNIQGHPMAFLVVGVSFFTLSHYLSRPRHYLSACELKMLKNVLQTRSSFVRCITNIAVFGTSKQCHAN